MFLQGMKNGQDGIGRATVALDGFSDECQVNGHG
jgi:hypothetical protein